MVLFKGGASPATSRNHQLPPTKEQLLEAIEGITPKRNVVVRRLMNTMDGMKKNVDKELTRLMQRKRTVEKQDSHARQIIRQQELADRLAGDGYIAIRFEDRFGNRPFTAL